MSCWKRDNVSHDHQLLTRDRIATLHREKRLKITQGGGGMTAGGCNNYALRTRSLTVELCLQIISDANYDWRKYSLLYNSNTGKVRDMAGDDTAVIKLYLNFSIYEDALWCLQALGETFTSLWLIYSINGFVHFFIYRSVFFYNQIHFYYFYYWGWKVPECCFLTLQNF